jgi:hypothetical protein
VAVFQHHLRSRHLSVHRHHCPLVSRLPSINLAKFVVSFIGQRFDSINFSCECANNGDFKLVAGSWAHSESVWAVVSLIERGLCGPARLDQSGASGLVTSSGGQHFNFMWPHADTQIVCCRKVGWILGDMVMSFEPLLSPRFHSLVCKEPMVWLR